LRGGNSRKGCRREERERNQTSPVNDESLHSPGRGKVSDAKNGDLKGRFCNGRRQKSPTLKTVWRGKKIRRSPIERLLPDKKGTEQLGGRERLDKGRSPRVKGTETRKGYSRIRR